MEMTKSSPSDGTVYNINTMEALVPARPCRLPLELWMIIVEKAAEEFEFGTLFALARVNRALANIALPLMYGDFEHLGVTCGRADEAFVCFWRSIILSSMGVTSYPYCLWIKVLDLFTLQHLLRNLVIRGNEPLRQKFYSPPLDYLEDLHKFMPYDPVEWSNPHLFEVVDEITSYIKIMADQRRRIFRPRLVHLRGLNLNDMSAVFSPIWASRLTGLTTLHVTDGRGLGDALAQSIAQHCPAFKNFICTNLHWSDQSNVVRFCEQLPPNSLESFSIPQGYVADGIGHFQALDKHSQSLRELNLGGLEPSALRSLDRLRNCTNLETLSLASHVSMPRLPFPLWPFHAKAYSGVVAWLKSCSQLVDLSLFSMPGSDSLLRDILKKPTFQLTDLYLQTSEARASWYSSLRRQKRLRSLQIEITDMEVQKREPIRGRCKRLAKALSKLPELRELNVNELFSVNDIAKICEGALNLEKVYLDGPLIHDAYLVPLAKLPRLKELDAFGDSEFTVAGLLTFIENLKDDPEGEHDGFELCIWRQGIDFGEEGDNELGDAISEAFQGKFDIFYIDSDGEEY